MSRKIAALRVLCERRLAKRFQETTKGMKAEQISLHLQSVLAAALVNPGFVVADIVRGKAMALQVGSVRGQSRPVLLALPCSGQKEREAFRRLVMALTYEVSALVAGPVMPDASTVVRALIAEWLTITTLNRRNDPSDAPGRRRGPSPAKRRKRRTSKPRGKSRTTRSTSPRRKKPTKRTTKADSAVPHPDFPDVSAKPIDWRPGRRGRPPRGAVRRKDGSWSIPNGFRVIKGKVHPPLALSREPAPVQKASPQGSQQSRQARTPRTAEEALQPNSPLVDAEVLHQEATKQPSFEPPAEKPLSSASGTEPETSSSNSSGEPP